MGAIKDARQEKFCQKMANGGMTQEKAAIAAGYSPKAACMQASRLLTKDNIKNRIDELREKVADNAVDEVKKLKIFWESVINNEDERMAIRLKASELYGRSIAAFVERREVEFKNSLADVIGAIDNAE